MPRGFALLFGKNLSALACDYICFVEYERSFQVDILQGTIVE